MNGKRITFNNKNRAYFNWSCFYFVINTDG